MCKTDLFSTDVKHCNNLNSLDNTLYMTEYIYIIYMMNGVAESLSEAKQKSEKASSKHQKFTSKKLDNMEENTIILILYNLKTNKDLVTFF